MKISELILPSESEETPNPHASSKYSYKTRKSDSLQIMSITPRHPKNESSASSIFSDESTKSFTTTSKYIRQSNKSFIFPSFVTFSNDKCSISTCDQQHIAKPCNSHSFCLKHKPKTKSSCSLCKCSKCNNSNVSIKRCGIKLCLKCQERFSCCVWCCYEIDKLNGQDGINARIEVNLTDFKKFEKKVLMCYACKKINLHYPCDEEICKKCYFSFSKGINNSPYLMIYKCCECEESKIDFVFDFASEMIKKKDRESPEIFMCMVCKSSLGSIDELRKLECGHQGYFECFWKKCELSSEKFNGIFWNEKDFSSDFFEILKMTCLHCICKSCLKSCTKCFQAFCGLCMKEINFTNTCSDDYCFKCYYNSQLYQGFDFLIKSDSSSTGCIDNKKNEKSNVVSLIKCVKCTYNIENDLGICERCFLVDQYGNCDYGICQNCLRYSWSILIKDCIHSICKICLNLNENNYCCIFCIYFFISNSNCKHKNVEDFKMAQGYQKFSSYFSRNKDALRLNYSELFDTAENSDQIKNSELCQSNRDDLVFDFNENKLVENEKVNCSVCNCSKDCSLQNCGHIVCLKHTIKSTCQTCYKKKCSKCNKSSLPKLISNCKNHIFCTQCFKKVCSICPNDFKPNLISPPKNIISDPKIKSKFQYNFKSFSKPQTIKQELNNRIKTLEDLASSFVEKSFELINWMSKEIEEKLKNIENTINGYKKLLDLVHQGDLNDEHEKIISSSFKVIKSFEINEIKNIFARRLFAVEEKYWCGNYKVLDSSDNYIAMELKNNSISIVDIESKNNFTLYHSDKITSTQIFESEKLIFSSSSDGTIIKWDLSRKFAKKHLIKEKKSIINFNISNNLETLIYITEDFQIKIYDLINCKHIEMIAADEGIEKSAISANQSILFYSTAISLIKFDLDSKTKFSVRKQNFYKLNQMLLDERSERILCLTENSIELINNSDLSSISSLKFEISNSFIGFVGFNKFIEFDFEESIKFLKNFVLNEEITQEVDKIQKPNILVWISQKYAVKLSQEELILY